MISDAIKRAYGLLSTRTYERPRIYWTIDLHDTCIKSNYQRGGYEWINGDVVETLKYILSFPESVIILWSSCYPEVKREIKEFFESADLTYHYFNENPEALDTKTGHFGEKFYSSIIIDDKAGFNADTDWKIVQHTLKQIKNGKI